MTHFISRRRTGSLVSLLGVSGLSLLTGACTDLPERELGSASAELGLPIAKVTAIAGAGAASLVAKSDGTVWTWGDNPGDGTTIDALTAVPVGGLSGVKAVAVGTGTGDIDGALVLKSNGTVFAWGANDHGQAGFGTALHHASPGQVDGLSGVIAVASASTSYSLALKWDGTVHAWGWNVYGQLGNGFGPDHTSPTQITGLSDITAVVAAPIHGLALKADGTVWNWGFNGNGELGIGTIGGSTIPPVQVIGLTDVAAVASGAGFSLALKSDGTVWAWGNNAHGALGIGTIGGQYPTAVRLDALSDVVAIAAGRESFGLALKSDGTVWAWGANNQGQLGDGTLVERGAPEAIDGLSGVTRIAAGRLHGLVRKSDGTVWAWGHNAHGQLGDGTTARRLTPVPSLLP